MKIEILGPVVYVFCIDDLVFVSYLKQHEVCEFSLCHGDGMRMTGYWGVGPRVW
jgi:hypothetical protein